MLTMAPCPCARCRLARPLPRPQPRCKSVAAGCRPCVRSRRLRPWPRPRTAPARRACAVRCPAPPQVHLAGAGVGEADFDAGIDQRFHEGLCAVGHGVFLWFSGRAARGNGARRSPRREDAAGQKRTFQRALAAGAAAAKNRPLRPRSTGRRWAGRAVQTRLCQVGLQAAQALRVMSCIWMAMNGPAPAFAAGPVRRCAACPAPLARMQDAADLVVVVQLGAIRKLASKASAVACSTSGCTSCDAVSAFILAARPARVSSTRKWRLSAAIWRTRRWLPSRFPSGTAGTACRGCAGCARRPRWQIP